HGFLWRCSARTFHVSSDAEDRAPWDDSFRPSYFASGADVWVKSQTRTSPWFGSAPPALTSDRPSGENATASTHIRCPARSATRPPVATSQSATSAPVV